jgi:hypothetical protein
VKSVVIHPDAEYEADLAFEQYWEMNELAAIRFWDQLKDA